MNLNAKSWEVAEQKFKHLYNSYFDQEFKTQTPPLTYEFGNKITDSRLSKQFILKYIQLQEHLSALEANKKEYKKLVEFAHDKGKHVMNKQLYGSIDRLQSEIEVKQSWIRIKQLVEIQKENIRHAKNATYGLVESDKVVKSKSFLKDYWLYREVGGKYHYFNFKDKLHWGPYGILHNLVWWPTDSLKNRVIFCNCIKKFKEIESIGKNRDVDFVWNTISSHCGGNSIRGLLNQSFGYDTTYNLKYLPLSEFYILSDSLPTYKTKEEVQYNLERVLARKINGLRLTREIDGTNALTATIDFSKYKHSIESGKITFKPNDVREIEYDIADLYRQIINICNIAEKIPDFSDNIVDFKKSFHLNFSIIGRADANKISNPNKIGFNEDVMNYILNIFENAKRNGSSKVMVFKDLEAISKKVVYTDNFIYKDCCVRMMLADKDSIILKPGEITRNIDLATARTFHPMAMLLKAIDTTAANNSGIEIQHNTNLGAFVSNKKDFSYGRSVGVGIRVTNTFFQQSPFKEAFHNMNKDLIREMKDEPNEIVRTRDNYDGEWGDSDYTQFPID